MTNADVINMLKAGLGESVVIAAIRKTVRTDFRVDAESLILLKTSGASDNLVSVMLDPSAAPPAAPASPPAAVNTTGTSGTKAANPANAAPDAPREPGIYADMGDDTPKLIALEPTTFSQGKSGGFFTSALTYGIKKAKWKAVVRSAASNFRIAESVPTFYFYFEQKGSGLSHTGGFGGWLSGASSPNEFVLANMTAN